VTRRVDPLTGQVGKFRSGVDSSHGQAKACPRCGRPAIEGHACGKRAVLGADKGTAVRGSADASAALGSSPTIGVAEARPRPPQSLIGHMLGKNYRVVEPIGAGGMGVVYLVEHVKLKKRFAAKVLNPELAMNAEAAARFEVEAHAVSQLDHDNIVNVIDYGQSEEGAVFLVMEHLKGRTLQARIDQAALSREEVLGVMVQVCRALGCAHEAGIVHRDMKPDNIFLNERGRGRPPLVKVLDFGISKARDAGPKDGRITKAGQVLGSPEYMSPEAARGDEVDARADIYAVGIILYELVTGTVPFRHDNYLKVLQKHISDIPTPPRQQVPDLSAGFEALILRALAKDPDQRQQSMEELEAELVAAMPEEARGLASLTPMSSGAWLITPPTGIPIGSRMETPVDVTPGPNPVTPPPAIEVASTAIEATAPVIAARRRGHRIVLVAGLIAVLAAILYLVAGGGDEKSEGSAAAPPPDAAPEVIATPIPPPIEDPVVPSSSPDAAPVAAPDAAVAPQRTIRFRIDSTPRGAAVYLNGKLLGKTPLTASVASSDKGGQLRVVLRDHTPVTRRVDLSRPVELRLPLAPVVKPDQKKPDDLQLREAR
jgi:serine/threonine protein kinase